LLAVAAVVGQAQSVYQLTALLEVTAGLDFLLLLLAHQQCMLVVEAVAVVLALLVV
jgi:hypothetical protein